MPDAKHETAGSYLVAASASIPRAPISALDATALEAGMGIPLRLSCQSINLPFFRFLSLSF